jgi:hypothetical protein
MDSSYGGTKMTIRLSEKAMYTTVKLTVEKSGSNEIATGFIFKYFSK